MTTPTGALVGFARVSTQGQDLSDQLYKLKEAGCEEDKIFSGKHSGKADANAEALAELERYVRKGDTVVVTKLDRLGRSVGQVVSFLDRMKDKGVYIKALEQGIDTGKANDPIATAMTHLLAVFAEMERSMIQSRMEEGKAAAVRSGKHTEQSVKGGRKHSYTNKQEQDVIDMIKAGQKVTAIAKDTGLTRATVYRIKDKIDSITPVDTK